MSMKHKLQQEQQVFDSDAYLKVCSNIDILSSFI